MKSKEQILEEHIVKVEGCTVEDFRDANKKDPEVFQALLDAMEEYSDQMILVVKTQANEKT